MVFYVGRMGLSGSRFRSDAVLSVGLSFVEYNCGVDFDLGCN